MCIRDRPERDQHNEPRAAATSSSSMGGSSGRVATAPRSRGRTRTVREGEASTNEFVASANEFVEVEDALEVYPLCCRA